MNEKHDHAPLIFPDNFLWGTATSAHQVEGENIHSDWWEWEFQQPLNLRSGKACDEYHLYEKDFDLAKKLNTNAHRLSIEWARIEPEEGKFDEGEIKHYVQVLKALKRRGFIVMLTLWHFTLPAWLAKKGGWANGASIKYFDRFVKRVVPELAQNVNFWITLNEPSVYAYMAYLVGSWPPQKKSNLSSLIVTWNLAQAHKKAYSTLHSLVKDAKVGIAHNVQSFEPYHKHSFAEQILVALSDLLTNHLFYFLTKSYHDFLGINYYFHHRFRHQGGILPKVSEVSEEYRDVSDLGWEVYPEGIFDVLTDLSNHLPIFITECGIASTNDDRRSRFLIHYLQEVYRAIQAGVKVKGFFYWSLIDNFEWHRGFEPRFGLIEVDYATQQRSLRPSAYVYSEIIRRNGIPHAYLRLLGHTVKAEEVLCHGHDGPKALCEHLVNSRYPDFSKAIDFKSVSLK